jgi:hypothetical protein
MSQNGAARKGPTRTTGLAPSHHPGAGAKRWTSIARSTAVSPMWAQILDRRFASPSPASPARFASFDVLRSGTRSGEKGKPPPVECVNSVEPGSGRASDFVFIIRPLSPTGALSHAIFVSDFPDLCYTCSWFPKRPASEAGSEAGMDCRTALAKQARLHPCGEALRRRVFACPRAPAPAAEGRVGEKGARNLDSPASP